MYGEYARYARYLGYGILDERFFAVMRGERGEWVRKAADDEKRDENIYMLKLLAALIMIAQILAILADGLFSWLDKDYKQGIFERVMPEILKEGSVSDKPIQSRKMSNVELQNSPLLTNTELWD